MAAKPSQPMDDANRTDRIDRMDRVNPPEPRAGRRDEPSDGACSTPIDRNAPAGARNSLGAKSDCNGRPSTDDSVVEAKDELDPAIPPPMPEPRSGSR